MLFLNESTLASGLKLDDLRDALALGFKAIATHHTQNFPRMVVNTSEQGIKPLGFMPAYDKQSALLGYKAISVFNDNNSLGLNPHQGLVVLLDSNTGIPKALLDGQFITAVRTATVSALATDNLAKEDASVLTLIGAGKQALEHIKALTRIRRIKKINVCCRTETSFEYLVNQSTFEKQNMHYFSSAKAALCDADIVVTCTPGHSPLFSSDDLKPGTHINAIGACRPGEEEVLLANTQGLSLFVDSLDACRLESDELNKALKSGVLKESTIKGTLTQLLHKTITGRHSPQDITFFKAVGIGLADLYTAEYFYQHAIQTNQGQRLIL